MNITALVIVGQQIRHRVLLDADVARSEDINRAKERVRALAASFAPVVGLDRRAVSNAFSAFITDRTASAEQIEFINMLVKHLTARSLPGHKDSQ